MSPDGRPPSRLRRPGFIAAVALLAVFFWICVAGLFAEFGGSNWGTNIIIVGVALAGLIGLGNLFYGRNSPYVKAHARSAPPPRMPPPHAHPQAPSPPRAPSSGATSDPPPAPESRPPLP